MDYDNNLINSNNIFTPHLSKEEEIKNIIREHWIIIDDYTINENGTLNINGNVKFPEIMNYHTVLPLKFSSVTGDFDISRLNLTTLYGCPSFIGGDFNCSYNHLDSLKYAPKKVDGNVYFFSASNKFQNRLSKYFEYIKIILKYHEYYEIWCISDNSLIDSNFDLLIEDILDGLE